MAATGTTSGALSGGGSGSSGGPAGGATAGGAPTGGTGTTTAGTTGGASTAAGAAGWGAVAVKGGGAPPAESDPPGNAHGMAIGTADGRPAGLAPGAPEAYWVWREGKAWHLRTTTKGALHKFMGWIAADGLSDVTASKLEVADKVRLGQKILHFEFSTAGHEDGLDFKAGDDCVRFHLRIDEKQEPNLIHIGASGAHPAKAHFRLCPDGKTTGVGGGKEGMGKPDDKKPEKTITPPGLGKPDDKDKDKGHVGQGQGKPEDKKPEKKDDKKDEKKDDKKK